MSEQPRVPLVFISYSHDSPEHKRWVSELADRLIRNGVQTILDQWDLRLGDDVPKFMERAVREADRVLMICTDAYVTKADGGTGGVGYESMIVTGESDSRLGNGEIHSDRASADQSTTVAGGALDTVLRGSVARP